MKGMVSAVLVVAAAAPVFAQPPPPPRWPGDTRFARPAAVLRATAGSAREAVLALDRYLEQPPNDEASLFLALTWMFEARRAGVALRDRSEDIRLARRYAAQYVALSGARQPLVQLWVDYIER